MKPHRQHRDRRERTEREPDAVELVAAADFSTQLRLLTGALRARVAAVLKPDPLVRHALGKLNALTLTSAELALCPAELDADTT